MTTHDTLPQSWEIVIKLDVFPEDDDTLETLRAHVERVAREWVEDGIYFDVRPEVTR